MTNKILQTQINIIGNNYTYVFKLPNEDIHIPLKASQHFRRVLKELELNEKFNNSIIYEHSWGVYLHPTKFREILSTIREKLPEYFKYAYKVINQLIGVCNINAPDGLIPVMFYYKGLVPFELCYCRLCCRTADNTFIEKLRIMVRNISLLRNPQKFMERNFYQEKRRCPKCGIVMTLTFFSEFSTERGFNPLTTNNKCRECKYPASLRWSIAGNY